ncbi:uncharacterized protein [Rutidosis leptorrhynchoides]|uniref:uncharacterized protein n=1 Tax=Rutidosis leptorrhynchoides TaxID=125765 RepID=UPI003A9A0330
MNRNTGVNTILTITNNLNYNQEIELLDNLDELNDDEEVEAIPGAPRRYLHRDRERTARALWNDYFSDTCTFSPDYFCRPYRMSKPLFLHIGLLSFQKLTSVIRQLAYASSTDHFDEYLHMGEQTLYDCLNNFFKCILHLYATEYLRKPNAQDVQRLTAKHAEIHGFSGMLGSVDCMHWGWKNCPTCWKGHYTRGCNNPTSLYQKRVPNFFFWT